jgi:hypothetical protein
MQRKIGIRIVGDIRHAGEWGSPGGELGEWQRLQPMVLNTVAPFTVDGVDGAGVGGAERRMNAAKFTISDDISDTVPSVVPKLGLLEFWFKMLVASSGDPLKTQPATALRSLGKFSLETPMLHVVSLSGKNQERLVLRFPAETSDRPVVAAGVEDALNLERRSGRSGRRKIGLQSGVGRGFHQAQPKQRRRDAENHIVGGKRVCEVRLRQRAARWRRSGPRWCRGRELHRQPRRWKS